jgi:hypothetical protein
MNGGAAVALLAFLQAIWETNAYLSEFVIGGIGFHSIGVLLAGCVPLFLYNASFNFQSGRCQRWLISAA